MGIKKLIRTALAAAAACRVAAIELIALPGAGRDHGYGQGTGVDDDVTFAQVADEWVARNVAHGGVRWQATRQAHIVRRDIAPALVSCDIRAVNDAEVDSLVKEWLREGVSPAAVRTRLCLLDQILRYAAAVGYRSDHVDMSKRVVTVQRRSPVLSLPATAQVASALPLHGRIPLWLMATAGLRLSEALALKVGDVDLEQATARVDQTPTTFVMEVRDSSASRRRISSKIRPRSTRTAAMPAALVDLLRNYLLTFPAPDAAPLCRTPSGHPINANAFRSMFRRALQQARVGQTIGNMSAHVLRRSWAALVATYAPLVHGSNAADVVRGQAIRADDDPERALTSADIAALIQHAIEASIGDLDIGGSTDASEEAGGA